MNNLVESSASLSKIGSPDSGRQVNGAPISQSERRRSEDDQEHPQAQRRGLNPALEEKCTRLLACPFAKNNPLKHQKCFQYTMEEIARLK